MKSLFIILTVAVLVAVVWRGLSVFWRHRRPGPANNWTNEHFLAMEGDGTWTENGQSVTHRDTNGPSIYPGIP